MKNSMSVQKWLKTKGYFSKFNVDSEALFIFFTKYMRKLIEKSKKPDVNQIVYHNYYWIFFSHAF